MRPEVQGGSWGETFEGWAAGVRSWWEALSFDAWSDWVDPAWLTAEGSGLVMVAISGLGIYAVLMAFTRLAGLRSFSKMSGFDFAITVAFGSVLASTLLSPTPSLATGAVGLLVLFLMHWGVSKFRRWSRAIEWLVDNQPRVLMVGGEVQHKQLAKARMTEEDLVGKLRQAGIARPSEVALVVFETTGDVSVLRADEPVDPWLLSGVKGAKRLAGEVTGGSSRRTPGNARA